MRHEYPAKYVGMIVYPRFSRDQISLCAQRIEKWHSVFTEKHKLLIENVIIDPALLLRRSKIREQV